MDGVVAAAGGPPVFFILLLKLILMGEMAYGILAAVAVMPAEY